MASELIVTTFSFNVIGRRTLHAAMNLSLLQKGGGGGGGGLLWGEQRFEFWFPLRHILPHRNESMIRMTFPQLHRKPLPSHGGGCNQYHQSVPGIK
jgi:hypothetical protein